ncbi:MAG: chromosome segregation protein SMC [Pyrinomonadaceae bacterium]
MFKLQRLEITGFKSFADHTEIVFTGTGITAVVGPNGCGKSNISDGISWVLGEQKAKSLRGEEMKDVIFQGTNKRAASGMAEVVLHLVRADTPYFEDAELSEIDEALNEIDDQSVNLEDLENAQSIETENPNADELAAETEQARAAQVGAAQVVQSKIKTKRHWKPRSFALDFAPGEAVSVTRRLYRSGESEYLLNGKQCRLRDIQDLFSGTGLSGAHYALIEQGRIGQILSAKPSDRRTLIEEAAGISKFRTRQRAAETRLESAKTNLRRISDIVDEIDKQANSLRRQAAKTRRYKILKEELRELLRQTYSAEGEFLTRLVNELKARLAESVERERELFAEVAAMEETARTKTAAARAAEEDLSILRARHAENALLRDRASRDLHYKEERIVNLKSRFDILQDEIKETEIRLKLIETEAARLTKDERKQNAEAEKEQLELTAAEQKYEQKILAVNLLDSEQEKERGELLLHTAAVERFAEIKRQLESGIERLTEREEGLKREGERAEKSFNEHLAESRKLEKELAALNAKVAKLRSEKQTLGDAVNEFRARLESAEKSFGVKREEFFRVNNRLETLQEIEAGKAIYAPPVQTLFKAQKEIGVKLTETLADKLNVEKQAEKAVENVFGNFLQAVIVESETDARKITKYLDANKIGRTAVLVQSSEFRSQSPESRVQSPESKAQSPKTNLINYLGVSESFAELLKQVFPRETAARVVEKLDKIKSETDEIFVTLKGDLLIGGKLFVSGRTNEKSLLSFKRELRELAVEGARLAKELEKSETETAKARKILEDKENEIVDLQSFIGQAERELLSQEIRSKNLTQETERAERHKKVVGDEIEQIEQELAEIRKRRTEAEINSQMAEKAKLAATEMLEKISRKLSEARQKTQSENIILNEKRMLAGVAAERRRAASVSLRRIENEQRELAARLARQKSEIAENETSVKELNSAIAEINQKIKQSGDEQIHEQNELTQAAANLQTARQKADAGSLELTNLNHAAANARNARAEIEVRQAETVTQLRNLNEICAQELNLPLVELVETVAPEKDFDLEAGRRQTDDLRRRIEGFGAVNMLALEELSEAEERLLFLTSQRQDIIDGIASAEEALREIKERSRERFHAAFEAINGYFKEFFVELFGGGNGEMNLLDAEDVLESGIEIVAQPPGKRLQNILLLSGGEKAMTAIALVMAIFQYRPSPFCLLDEVDAPLDDANVGRFVNKIAQMSENIQFIVVTHNKRTMEAARALYGVTMQEAGVSKVVSVKFE